MILPDVVPFLDLSRENRLLAPQMLEAASRVMASGKVLYGPELEAFEHELAEWHGVKHAVGVASGTDALEVAIRASSLAGPLSTTAMTAPATINAIEAAGCDPVLKDPDGSTRNASAQVFVHLYGLATDAMGTVEDCAHSMGATWEGRLAGTMGYVAALSFYPTKIMGAVGDGGAVLTSVPAIAERARSIRHYGMNGEGSVIARGQNSRLCELQAAFLRVKLPHVHAWIRRRREIAARYTSELKGRVVTPYEPPGCRAVYHVYVAEHPERDRIADGLRARGVGCMRHYDRAIHHHPRWAHLAEGRSFPVADRLAKQVLSLPCYPFMTEAEQDAVIAAVKELT